MPDVNWLQALYWYVMESVLESALILLVVTSALRWRNERRPAVVSQFLLLPLVIPVLLSPVLHVLFPRLMHSAIIVQIEEAFPMLEAMRKGSAELAPILVPVFLTLCALNVAQWLVIALREARQARRAEHVPLELNELSKRLALQFGVKTPRLIVSSHNARAAYVFGWRSPVITLGREWLSRLDHRELEAVLAHELAHFKRSDTWAVLAAKVCRDLMFFNPLAHYVHGKLVVAREEAADDLAVHITQKPLALASCLLKFWQARQPPRALASGLSLATFGDGLEGRIRRIVTHNYDPRPAPDADRLFYGLSLTLTVLFSVI